MGKSRDQVREQGRKLVDMFGSDTANMTGLAEHGIRSAEMSTLRTQKEELMEKLAASDKNLALEISAHAITKAELKGLSSAQGSSSNGKNMFELLSDQKALNEKLKEKVRQLKKQLQKSEFLADHNQAVFLSKLAMDAEAIKAFMPEKKAADSSDED